MSVTRDGNARHGHRVTYVRLTPQEMTRVQALAVEEQCSVSNLLRRGLSELLVATRRDPLRERARGRPTKRSRVTP